jgi:type II secretory pathway component PulJ
LIRDSRFVDAMLVATLPKYSQRTERRTKCEVSNTGNGEICEQSMRHQKRNRQNGRAAQNTDRKDFKNKELQTSDWNLKNPSLAQQYYLALDSIVSIMLYDLMKDMPDPSIRLTEDTVKEGMMVDVVPKFGSRAVMAHKAAEGQVVSLRQHWMAPVGIHPPTHPFQHQNARTCTHHSRSGVKLPDC